MKPGDTVVLKSSGPVMTISVIDADGVSCQWFDGKNLKHATFPATSLEIYDFDAEGDVAMGVRG